MTGIPSYVAEFVLSAPLRHRPGSAVIHSPPDGSGRVRALLDGFVNAFLLVWPHLQCHKAAPRSAQQDDVQQTAKGTAARQTWSDHPRGADSVQRMQLFVWLVDACHVFAFVLVISMSRPFDLSPISFKSAHRPMAAIVW